MPIKRIITNREQETFSTSMHFSVKWGPFFSANTNFLQTIFFANLGMWPRIASFVYCPPSAFAKVFFTPHEKPSPGFLVLSFWPLATHHRAGIVLSWAGHGGCFCMILSKNCWPLLTFKSMKILFLHIKILPKCWFFLFLNNKLL